MPYRYVENWLYSIHLKKTPHGRFYGNALIGVLRGSQVSLLAYCVAMETCFKSRLPTVYSGFRFAISTNWCSDFLLAMMTPLHGNALRITSSFFIRDVKVGDMECNITGIRTVCPVVCSGAHQRKHQRSASLAFVRRIHQWAVDSSYTGSITREMFPFDSVMLLGNSTDDG